LGVDDGGRPSSDAGDSGKSEKCQTLKVVSGLAAGEDSGGVKKTELWHRVGCRRALLEMMTREN
jgi:hypothetical protein